MHGDVERPTVPGVRCEQLGRRGAAAWRCMGLHACMPHSGFSNASHTVVFLGQCRKKSRLARTCSGTALARTLARMISPSWCQSRTTQRNRCSSSQQCLHAAQYGMHTCVLPVNRSIRSTFMTSTIAVCTQIFVFFPEEVKVGVKTIKVSTLGGCAGHAVAKHCAA